MKKTTAIMIVGMFVIVGCGSAVLGKPDNRTPNAPVMVAEKCYWNDVGLYTYIFYAEDPDGDQVYYDIDWKKACDSKIVSCSVDAWLGPKVSGEEIKLTQKFLTYGDYELTIRAKDTNGRIGPATTITITYKSSIPQFPILSKLMEKYPEIFKILAMIF